MLGDIVKNFLEFFAKYALAGAVLAGAILLLPDDAIKTMGLTAIRDDNRGIWWMVLIFCLVLALQGPANVGWRSVSSGFMARKNARESKKIDEEKAKKRRQTIEAKLSSLSDGENYVVIYCLMKNQQSFTTHAAFPPTNALVSKGLMETGQGTLLDLTYHFYDDVWGILKANSAAYLADKKLVNDLKDFENQNRRPY